MKEDPASLDPRMVSSVRDLTLMRQLYEGLMRPGLDGKIHYALAQSHEVSNDLLTYTFHLRDAFWNNGDPITAHDFVYSWSQVVDPNFASIYSYMLYPIKNARLIRLGKASLETLGIMARDDRTLVVQLERPTPYFLELMAFPTYFPIHARHHAKGGTDFIGSGPFALQNWKPTFEMTLIKNPTYWDNERVYLDGIQLTFLDDNNTESYLFEKGKLDWLGQPISNNIATELIAKLKQEGKLHSYPIDGTFWIKMNIKQEPFNSPLVRKAFALAANRHQIIEHILQGNQSIATGPVPPSMQLTPTPYFQDGDLTKAKSLFKQALLENGWTLETFPAITFTFPPTERNSKIAQLLQQQWQEAFSIPIELETMENQLYRTQTRLGNYQIGTGEWIADFHDPLAFLELFKDCDGVNDTRWQNSSYTQLLEASLTETNEPARLQLLSQAEKLLVDEMPIIPLYHYAFDYICNTKVKDVILSPLGTTDFKSAKLR